MKKLKTIKEAKTKLITPLIFYNYIVLVYESS